MNNSVHFNNKFLFLILLLIHILQSNYVLTIGCFKCSTLNNDTYCTDPFSPGNSNISDKYYEADCRAGMDQRTGLFPARYCLKVSGILAGTKDQVVIRTCTTHKLLDSDSSYSSFTLKLNERDLVIQSGLIASCRDDGCNSMSLMKPIVSKSLYIVFYSTILFKLTI